MGKIWGKYGESDYISHMATVNFYLKGDKSPSTLYVRLKDGLDLGLNLLFL